MAIGFGTNAYYTTTQTVAIPSGTGRYLIIAWANTGVPLEYIPTPSFNGYAMTDLTSAGASPLSKLCGFAIPDAWAAGNYTHNASSTYRRHHIILTGVDYNYPVVDTASYRQGSSTGTHSSITLSTVTGALDLSVIYYGSATITAGTGQNVLYNTADRALITYKSGLSAGTTTMSYTYTGQRTSQSDVVLRPTVPLPGAFNKSSPANAATAVAMNASNQVTLSWGASTNAVSYQYKISTTSGGGTYTSTGANTSVTVTLAHNTLYYWNVKAINTSGETVSNSGTQYSFTTEMETPTAFNKSSPANSSINVSRTPTLSWGTSTYATTYYYRYSTTSGGGTWTSNGSSTSKTLPLLSANTTYYWHVYATNNSGDIVYSNSNTQYSFTTRMETPGDFNKSSPANGATLQPKTNLTLSWGASAHATTYYYRYSTTSGGGTWTSNGSSTSKVITGLTPKATYYWHVYATNSSGDITYANSNTQWSFTVIADPPVAFGKIAPADGAIKQSLKPTLNWEASTDTTHYEYRYDLAPESGTWISNSVSTSITLPDSLLYNRKYYWQVRATGEGGTTYADGAISNEWDFTTTIPPIHNVVII